LTKEQIQKIVERTRGGGAEPAAQTASAYDAPAAAIAAMVDSISHNRRHILPGGGVQANTDCDIGMRARRFRRERRGTVIELPRHRNRPPSALGSMVQADLAQLNKNRLTAPPHRRRLHRLTQQRLPSRTYFGLADNPDEAAWLRSAPKLTPHELEEHLAGHAPQQDLIRALVDSRIHFRQPLATCCTRPGSP
jgi:hypothetical protein